MVERALSLTGKPSSRVSPQIEQRLAELRARQRRMSSDDEGYRELFEQIVGLENRRMQIAQLS